MDASPRSTDEVDGSTVKARSSFVEFSFIRHGWTKKTPYFNWFVPRAKRCFSFVVGTIEDRFIAATRAGVRGERALGVAAMPATSEATKDGLIIAIDPVITEAGRKIVSARP